jgi:hypothetical protein
LAATISKAAKAKLIFRKGKPPEEFRISSLRARILSELEVLAVGMRLC